MPSQCFGRQARPRLVKDCDPQEVFEAIRSAYERGSYINQITLKAIQNNLNKTRPSFRPDHFGLSKREVEILELICQQCTTEEIAERLFISVKTVNGHRTNLLQKTGSKNTAGLVMHALKNNIVRIF